MVFQTKKDSVKCTYNTNKHEDQKIVQRDAGEVRDEVPAKKGPKRLLMKAELRLLFHAPHFARNSEINASDLIRVGDLTSFTHDPNQTTRGISTLLTPPFITHPLIVYVCSLDFHHHLKKSVGEQLRLYALPLSSLNEYSSTTDKKFEIFSNA